MESRQGRDQGTHCKEQLMKLTDSLKAAAQRRSLKGWEKNSKLTGIEPLSEIQTAVVFIDANIPGVVQNIARIHEFFNTRGKKAYVYAVSMGAQLLSEGMQKATFIHKEDLKWYGRPKRGKHHPKLDMGEDMFISLFAEDSFAVEYAARCSNARFKVGRRQLERDTYDLVVTEPEGRHFSQIQAFDALMGFVSQIEY